MESSFCLVLKRRQYTGWGWICRYEGRRKTDPPVICPSHTVFIETYKDPHTQNSQMCGCQTHASIVHPSTCTKINLNPSMLTK